MALKLSAVLLLFSTFWLGVDTHAASDETNLSGTQKRGQQVFQQHCSVCHSNFALTNSKTYGPRLNKEIVDGNEDVVKQTIMEGRPGLMPAFKYGLTAPEIDSIIEFLKTVPSAQTPAKPK